MVGIVIGTAAYVIGALFAIVPTYAALKSLSDEKDWGPPDGSLTFLLVSMSGVSHFLLAV
jgi:hypothetical protein